MLSKTRVLKLKFKFNHSFVCETLMEIMYWTIAFKILWNQTVNYVTIYMSYIYICIYIYICAYSYNVHQPAQP